MLFYLHSIWVSVVVRMHRILKYSTKSQFFQRAYHSFLAPQQLQYIYMCVCVAHMQPVFVDGGATIFLTSARWHLSGVCFFRLFFIFVLLVPRRYNCTTCTLDMPMIHRRHQPLIWISLFYVHVNHQSSPELKRKKNAGIGRRAQAMNELEWNGKSSMQMEEKMTQRNTQRLRNKYDTLVKNLKVD